MKRYTKTKPSGVEWFGDVPSHWSVKRLKTGAECWISNVNKVPSADEVPVRLCNYTDVYYHDRITPDMELMETTAKPEEIQRFGLRVGDVVITKDSEDWTDIAVPSLVAESAPDLVCGYHLGIVRPAPGKLLGGYLLRAFQSSAVNQQFQIAASGVTRYGLPKAAIGNSWIPFPETAEQASIAAFLDRETSRIGELISKKRTLIERLKEKRTALISRTVTRGLPADLPEDTIAKLEEVAGDKLKFNPKLKPSGVEWLGDVPEHWEVIPLGYLTQFRGGATPNKSTPSFWDGDIPWVSPKDMKRTHLDDAEDHISQDAIEQCSLSLIPVDAVLIVVRGMILAHTLPVASTTVPLTINQDMKALIAGNHLHPEYLRLSLEGFSKTFVSLADESAHGTRKIDSTTLKRFPFILPPHAEQIAISSLLSDMTREIDDLSKKIVLVIERLQEYRSALITAAVTGKIDVRAEANSGPSTPQASTN